MLTKISTVLELLKLAWALYKNIQRALEVREAQKKIEEALKNEDRAQAASDIADML